MTLSATLRTAARHVIYATPLFRLTRFGAEPAHRTQAYWDTALAGRLKPYLGGTLSIDLRNAVTARLVHTAAPQARSLLDVGCAAGTLGAIVRGAGIERYVGFDISEFAIRHADRSLGEFLVADLCSFEPKDGERFDAIVFNEVLYYTDVEEAVRQLGRYAGFLAAEGVLVASLKNDPKCTAILRRAARDFVWTTGVLFQEHAESGRYAVRTDRERPAYLVGVLRPRAGRATR
jgi:predicted TPR repeat methyltransferase